MKRVSPMLFLSLLCAASIACGSSSEEDSGQASGPQAASPKPSGTTPGANPTASATGGSTNNDVPLVLPSASEVKVTVAKLGTLAPLTGGDFQGQWAADGARLLLPSSLASLIKLDKSGGTVTAAGALKGGKVKIGAKVKVTLQAILGAPQTVENDVSGEGTYTAPSDTHMTFAWTSNPSMLLPPEVDYSVSGEKGLLRFAEDIDGVGQAIVEVDLHRVR